MVKPRMLCPPQTNRALAAGAGLEVVRIELVEGRPVYLRFAAPTDLLGWLYARVVNRVPGLAWLRVLLVVELRKPGWGGQGCRLPAAAHSRLRLYAR